MRSCEVAIIWPESVALLVFFLGGEGGRGSSSIWGLLEVWFDRSFWCVQKDQTCINLFMVGEVAHISPIPKSLKSWRPFWFSLVMSRSPTPMPVKYVYSGRFCGLSNPLEFNISWDFSTNFDKNCRQKLGSPKKDKSSQSWLYFFVGKVGDENIPPYTTIWWQQKNFQSQMLHVWYIRLHLP